jgi:voltage-gated potassium channel
MSSKKESLAPMMIAAISALSILLLVGTLTYHSLERWSFIDSFYFSVTTLATVGYGDLYPTTSFSRLFTSFYILFGTTIALASIALIGTKYLEKREKVVEKRKEKKRRKIDF